jgi:hypothetical protein
MKQIIRQWRIVVIATITVAIMPLFMGGRAWAPALPPPVSMEVISVDAPPDDPAGAPNRSTGTDVRLLSDWDKFRLLFAR